MTERILDQAPDAVICANDSGTIIRWNYASTALFGYSAEEALGQSTEVFGRIPLVDGGIAQSMKFGVRASWSPIKGSRITPLSREPSAVEAAGSPGHPPLDSIF